MNKEHSDSQEDITNFKYLNSNIALTLTKLLSETQGI